MSPCLNCQERHIGCHDKCARYQSAKAEYAKKRKNRWRSARKADDCETDDYVKTLTERNGR